MLLLNFVITQRLMELQEKVGGNIKHEKENLFRKRLKMKDAY